MIPPQNAVMAFKLDRCPNGWSDYTPAYGRFIRGLDKSGSRIDPDGQRQLDSLQPDMIKKHAHSVGFTRESDGRAWHPRQHNGSRSGGNNSSETGGPETRPKNVALLYCIKD